MSPPEPNPPMVPEPLPPAAGESRRGLRKMGSCLSVVAVLVAAGWAVSKCEDARRSRVRRSLAQVQAEHGGKIAWWDKDDNRVRWRDLGKDGQLGDVTFVETGLKARRVAWSSDGATLFVLLESGAFDKVHRIAAINVATKELRTILDLGAEKLEDNDIDPDEFWVTAYGEAESEQDRITFRLGKGYWYTVEGKRPRVRPVAGAPGKKWDQEACPDGTHRLVHDSNEDDSWLELRGEDEDVKVTGDDAGSKGAWWVPAK